MKHFLHSYYHYSSVEAEKNKLPVDTLIAIMYNLKNLINVSH